MSKAHRLCVSLNSWLGINKEEERVTWRGPRDMPRLGARFDRGHVLLPSLRFGIFKTQSKVVAQ